ncbi:hypothetical protein TRFO_21112 [Tritrichomonas foetus]|uniref:Uncharacterized protein n=1 Tax=Tritrichomonas foetus TaxID=1144522 RepID=A0A1J4KEG0_9EUKA|nr:hypothetical protein TRFO_21112 [Tritrichomonas foetus]|eukprot:OHT09831.1 hypothetical protein TRFO_21112 [Tritrichomonas foetus]
MQSFSLVNGNHRGHSYNFRIIFNDTEYMVNSSIASENSKVIRKKIMKDPTLNEIKIDFEDPYDEFKQIVRLLRGKMISFNREVIPFLLQAAYKLKMESLYIEATKFQEYLEEMEAQLSKNVEMHQLTKLQDLLYSVTRLNFNDTIEEIYGLGFFNKGSDVKTLGRIVLSAFKSNPHNVDIYVDLIGEIAKKIKDVVSLISGYYLSENGKESKFLVQKFLEKKLLSENVFTTTSFRSVYFIHIFFKIDPAYFLSISNILPGNIDELAKNDWELHKKYASEGINQDPIAVAIRNDNIDELQAFYSTNDFNINMKIPNSIYESCTMVSNSPTLIQYAAYFRSINCFKFLLMNHALDNEQADDLTKFAVAGGSVEIIRLCEQNNCDFTGMIDIAIEYNRFDIFEWMMRSKPKLCKDVHQMLIKCIQKSNMKILRYLLEIGVGIYKRNNVIQLPLYAASEDNYKLLKFFIDSGQIDLNQRSNELTPLHVACQLGYYDIVEYLLLFKETNINAVYVFNLFFIRTYHHQFNFFIFGGRVNYPLTPLFFACKKGNDKIVSLILNHDDIKINGETATLMLTAACQFNSPDVIDTLLNIRGCDINNSRFEFDGNPLCFACQCQAIECVKKLLAHPKLNVNARFNNKTALHIACKSGNYEIVRLLLSHKDIDVNAVGIKHYFLSRCFCNIFHEVIFNT